MRQSTIQASASLSLAQLERAEQDQLYPFSIQPSGDDNAPWRIVDLSRNAWGAKYSTYSEAKDAILVGKQAAEAL